MARDRCPVAHHHLKGIGVDVAGEILCRGMVGGCDGPGHGELARGVDLAREQVGDGVSALHAWLPGAEDGIGIAAPGGCLDDGAGIDDDDDGLACCVEGIADVDNQVVLVRDEVELGLDVAVDALTSLAADGDDGGIGSSYFLVDGDGREGYLGILLLAHHLGLEPFGRMALGLELHAGIGDILTVDVGEGRRGLDASVLEALEHIDHVRGMDAAGARTAGEEVVGVLAEEGDGLDAVLPGQGAVVLEEDDALGGTLAGDGGMGLEVGTVAEAGRLHDIF